MRCEFEDLDSRRAEQEIVDAWITATECTGIAEIIVEHDAVIVHGTRHQPHDVAGTALRHGDLFAELDQALESMRSPSRREEPALKSRPTILLGREMRHPTAEIAPNNLARARN